MKYVFRFLIFLLILPILVPAFFHACMFNQGNNLEILHKIKLVDYLWAKGELT